MMMPNACRCLRSQAAPQQLPLGRAFIIDIEKVQDGAQQLAAKAQAEAGSLRIVLVSSGTGTASAAAKEAATVELLESLLGRIAGVEDQTESPPDGPLARWLLQRGRQLGGWVQRWSSQPPQGQALQALTEDAQHIQQLQLWYHQVDVSSPGLLQLWPKLSRVEHLQLGVRCSALDQLTAALAGLPLIARLGLTVTTEQEPAAGQAVPMALPPCQQLQELQLQSDVVSEIKLPASVCATLQRLEAPRQRIYTAPGVGSLPALIYLNSHTLPAPRATPQALQAASRPSFPALQSVRLGRVCDAGPSGGDTAAAGAAREAVARACLLQQLPSLRALHLSGWFGSLSVATEALPLVPSSVSELELELGPWQSPGSAAAGAQQAALRRVAEAIGGMAHLTTLRLHGGGGAQQLLEGLRDSAIVHLALPAGVTWLDAWQLPKGLQALEWAQWPGSGRQDFASGSAVKQVDYTGGPLQPGGGQQQGLQLPRLQRVTASAQALQALRPLFEGSLRVLEVLDAPLPAGWHHLRGIVQAVQGTLQQLTLPELCALSGGLVAALQGSACRTITLRTVQPNPFREEAESASTAAVSAWLAAGGRLAVGSTSGYQLLYSGLRAGPIEHAVGACWEVGGPSLAVVYSG
jgi:hypothetical protein